MSEIKREKLIIKVIDEQRNCDYEAEILKTPAGSMVKLNGKAGEILSLLEDPNKRVEIRGDAKEILRGWILHCFLGVCEHRKEESSDELIELHRYGVS